MDAQQNLKFERYTELLLKWNEKINLTAIADPRGIESHHFEDSLAPLPLLANSHSLVDLGAGAGFPGIPLKIAKPELHVVLVEATRKKIAFCNEVIRTLGLEGIEAINGRAENMKIQQSVGMFEAVISRATWPLETYLEMADPYYNDGGICIAMRGAKWEQELGASADTIKHMNLTLTTTHPYTIGNKEKRCLLTFSKVI